MAVVVQASVSQSSPPCFYPPIGWPATAWIAASFARTTLLLTSEHEGACKWKRIEGNQGDRRAHSLKAKLWPEHWKLTTVDFDFP